MVDSNNQLPSCEDGTLTIELIPLLRLVRIEGLEPPTFSLGRSRSIQLSYTRNGRSGGARTHYLKVRNLALCPVELHFQRLSSNRICGLTLANRQGLPEDWKYFALVVISSCQRTRRNGGVAGNRTPVRNVAPAQSFTRLAATCRLALRNGLPQPSPQCIGDFETVSCTNREHSPMLLGKTSVDYPAQTTLIPHLCE